jgi:hypothetical protein
MVTGKFFRLNWRVFRSYIKSKRFFGDAGGLAESGFAV